MLTQRRIARPTTLACSFVALLALGACTQTVQAPESTPNLRTTAMTYVPENLGTLGGNLGYVSAVNADGSVVVGGDQTTSGEDRAFRWTASGGMQDLGYGHARAVSADGSVVVGQANGAVRWTAAGGMENLGSLGADYGYATGVSADGSVVVGRADTSNNYSGAFSRAFRWTTSGGMEDLGTLPGDLNSVATSVSANGSVVVGVSGEHPSSGELHAFRWTASGGMQDLGLVGIDYVVKVSADGSTVIGSGINVGNYVDAFRWTAAGGREDLGSLPGAPDGAWIRAQALSADGSVVVGYGYARPESNSIYQRAFRWTASGGMEDLGTLGGMHSYAHNVSADGSVVVGTSSVASGYYPAFVWTAAGGMQRLADPGNTYEFLEFSAVSADGAVVAGHVSQTYYDEVREGRYIRLYPVRWVRRNVSAEDGDGIGASVDGRTVSGSFVDESETFSNSFTDQHQGGTSFGEITDRSDVEVSVTDSSSAELGVDISAQGGGGTAKVKPCGVAFTMSLTDGDSVIATCGSLLAKVVSGSVDIDLSNGATVGVPEGAAAFMDEQADGNFTVENRSGSQAITITFEGQPRTVAPGESADAEPKAQIDSYTVTFDGVPTGRVISSVRLGSGIVSSTGSNTGKVDIYAKRSDKNGNVALVTGSRRDLIISKDGRSGTSYSEGGNILFGFTNFGSKVAVKTLKVTGVTTTGGVIDVLDNTKLVKRVAIPRTGASGSATLTVDGGQANIVRIYLKGSGSVDDLVFEAARP